MTPAEQPGKIAFTEMSLLTAARNPTWEINSPWEQQSDEVRSDWSAVAEKVAREFGVESPPRIIIRMERRQCAMAILLGLLAERMDGLWDMSDRLAIDLALGELAHLQEEMRMKA